VKRFGFGVGLALVVVALATAVAQLFSLLAHGGYVPIALAAIWSSLDAESLEHVRVLAEQEVAPPVWQALRWLLSLPAWLVTGVPGGLLLFACRRGRGFDQH
jgi:hypothetical protein